MKLPTALEMKNLDHSATEIFEIPSIVLMENAGLGTVKMIEEELGPCKNTFALIFVGPGNNGGDGLVIGRHLHQRGCQPVFFFLVNPDTLKGDSAVNLQIIKKLKLPFHVIDNPARVETIPVLYKHFESRGLSCYAVIDAIFGIGLCREVTDHFADAIDLINTTKFCPKSPGCFSRYTIRYGFRYRQVLGTCVRADLPQRTVALNQVTSSMEVLPGQVNWKLLTLVFHRKPFTRPTYPQNSPLPTPLPV